MYQVDHHIEVDLTVGPTTISDLFNEACRTYGQKPALICEDEKLSYNDFARLSARLACYLQQQGLEKGDVIALMMPNVLAYPITLFGAFLAGLTVVNINPMYTLTEVERIIVDSKAKTLVIFKPVLAIIEKLADRAELTCVISVSPGRLMNENEGGDLPLDGVADFSTTLKAGADGYFQADKSGAADIAFLQYTGGTTGLPKAAMLSHGNITACVKQYQAMTSFVEPGREVALVPLPLYHIFGLVVCLLSSLSQGSSILLVTHPRDVSKMADLFRKWPVTMMYGVNTLYSGLYHAGNLVRKDLSLLKICASGATALSRDIAEKWRILSGCPIIEGYGMTETSGIISIQPDNKGTLFGTVGVPLPNSEISIRDEKRGNVLGPGEPGELCVKGPQVMSGYFNNPDENEKAFTADGFFRTGDIARIDERGYIWIVDRVKDMINVSGFNVYPNEVEQVINTFEGILESACIGTRDEKSGEVVKAYIVSERKQEIDVDQLLAHCRNHLTAYKIPKYIIHISSLPKTPVGKILRRMLKENKDL